jgi:hypothetical protein
MNPPYPFTVEKKCIKKEHNWSAGWVRVVVSKTFLNTVEK